MKTCCYDLHKAFDSVEYGVLLYNMTLGSVQSARDLYELGVQHLNACQVQQNGIILIYTAKGCPARVSSISHSVSTIVMDLLLREMESLCLGASLTGLYLGALN